MTICVISDLHGYLPPYPSEWWGDLKSCEILCICGDIFPLYIQTDMIRSKQWLLEDFKPWAADLPVEKVLFIGGNHDFFCERCKKDMLHWFSKHDKVTYLHNSGIDYISTQDTKVYSIFGSPYCHQFGSWAFMRDEEILVEKFSKIPENLDILITHDAPYGTSDICFEGFARNKGHIGCPELRDAIIEKKPSWCIHGHLHSSSHEIEYLNDTKVVNCSILNENYEPCFLPQIIKL